MCSAVVCIFSAVYVPDVVPPHGVAFIEENLSREKRKKELLLLEHCREGTSFQFFKFLSLYFLFFFFGGVCSTFGMEVVCVVVGMDFLVHIYSILLSACAAARVFFL